MKPALSVIFFTVASGAGLGLTVWVLAAQLSGRVGAADPVFLPAVALAGVLLTAGLLSSTAHLANPRNAWRAFSRFRTSWLSREGVFAVAIYPLAALHLWASVQGLALARLSALALIALALVTVASTAMIYACLKTVPRWRTWHTPVAYLLYALAAGGLLWVALTRSAGPADPGAGWAIGLLAAVALVKLAYYAKFSARVHATLNQALSVPERAAPGKVQGRVRLLDAGHTGGTFLTNEFGFAVARSRAQALRTAMFVLSLLLPAALLLLGQGPLAAWLAALAALAGMLLERWLFFAQAEHVVRLYHGQQAV